MNELLGWYGYEGVDRLDLPSKTSCLTTLVVSDFNDKSEIKKNGVEHQDEITTNNSSRENSKSPCSHKTIDKQDLFCGWCRQEVTKNPPDFLTTSYGSRYCSESCFTQSRRASFKRAKTCDWCRHVRHAIKYVDFQDGASQLQFCSDKCLNQYKMQIFCKETEAHLDMNPHLREKGIATTSGLITPDLWLKNCRSRSVSPLSEISQSRSPTPPTQLTTSAEQVHKYVSARPVSKLIPKNSNFLNIRQLTKYTRKRRTSKTTTSITENMVINSENENNSLLNLVNREKDINLKNLANKLKTNSTISTAHTNVQGLCFNVPLIPTTDTTVPNVCSSSQISSPLFPNPPNTYQERLPIPCHTPLFKLPFSTPSSTSKPTQSSQSFFGTSIPSITMTIPYPIIVPLPIPIPIPLPIFDFLKANKKNGERTTENTSQSNFNEPLDFTQSKTSSEAKNMAQENFEELNCRDLSNSGSEHESHSFPLKLNSKHKITRFYARRLIAKEFEKSRPLRKRKRVIDYLRNSNENDYN